jgi:hypothetical protein
LARAACDRPFLDYHSDARFVWPCDIEVEVDHDGA